MTDGPAPDHTAPTSADPSRTLDGGQPPGLWPSPGVPTGPEPQSAEAPVQFAAGQGSGGPCVPDDAETGGGAGPEAESDSTDILLALIRCQALHGHVALFLADTRRYSPALSKEGSQRAAYHALRFCEVMERELGCCPCRRRRAILRGRTCGKCADERPARRNRAVSGAKAEPATDAADGGAA